MHEELVFADSAGHTLIDVEMARLARKAANEDAPPTLEPEETREDGAVSDS